MREGQIVPAAVYVEGFSQVFHRHRRALEMPTGPAFTKRRWPPRFVPLFWLFPQHEVARISLFVFVDIHARARNISFELQSRQLAVTRESSDAVIERTIARVGMLSIGEPVHQIDHFRYMSGRTRHFFRLFDVEGNAIF